MNKLIFFLVLAVLLGSCEIHTPDSSERSEELQITSKPDTLPKVTGIGGIFFKAQNPAEVKKWYGENLGLAVDEFGSPFEFRNAHRPEEVNYLNWDAFEDSTTISV